MNQTSRARPGTTPPRRRPVGADLRPGGGVHFRVWAPAHEAVEVVLEGGPGAGDGRERPALGLSPEGDGYYSGVVPSAGVGTRYRYRLGRGGAFPDPAS